MSGWVAEPTRFELGTDGPRAIVVGVDGTASSLRALHYAAGLARRQGSRVLAVYVQSRSPASPLDPYGTTLGVAVQARQDLETSLRDEVARLREELSLDLQLVVRVGDARRELTAVAKEERADAVIVGASRHFGARITGSLGVRLVRRSGWPVTVVG